MACQARGLPRGHCRGHEEMLNLKGAGMYWEALGSNVARDSGSANYQRVCVYRTKKKTRNVLDDHHDN